MKKKWLLPLAALVIFAGVVAYGHAKTKPQYAWLVFGPEGKLRVQVCLEGEALTLEHFVDGKSTGCVTSPESCASKLRERNQNDISRAHELSSGFRSATVYSGSSGP